MVIISPSILSCDFSNLGKEIERTDKTEAAYIHIDVMDGSFVPNLTIGPCVVKALRKYSKKIFDVHLMIDEPIRYVEEFIESGADIITVHAEACSDIGETLRLIRRCGAKSGLSIKPDTSPEIIRPYLSLCDMVLVMTVEPGFGGQSFMGSAVKNINFVKQMIDDSGMCIPIEVDGGITTETIAQAALAGAEIFVAGSAVYKKDDISIAVRQLIEAAEKTQNN